MPSPADIPSSTTTQTGNAVAVSQTTNDQVSPTGERQVFRALRRQLTDDDLANPGVQKLILHMLEQAEADRDEADAFRVRYNDADKKVAVLEEKGKTATAIDVAYGAGTGAGGVMMGAAFYFWGKSPPEDLPGRILFWLGLALFVGGILIKVIKAK